MRPVVTRRERGMALLALLAVVALGSAWYLLTRLYDESTTRPAVTRARNAEVLIRAKQALVGYVAAQAAKGMPYPEDNPGAFPCPEHPWYIGLTDKEGGAGPSIGVANPGYGTANCSSIGRFPWRTIGTEKLVDANGEPLWYVVGPTWRKTSTSTKTNINSNTAGDVLADGQQAVALIIAPGPTMAVQAGTTPAGLACGARNQSRSAPAGTMDPLDYLECFNAAALQFATAGPGTSFNDQVIKVTVADVMPAIEAAIADRIAREIAPALNTVYTPASWGFTGSNPLYPFAAPFGNPTTSNYQGVVNTYAGLLPFNQTQSCTPATDARCTTTMLAFSKAGNDIQTAGSGYIRTQSSCSWSATEYVCTGEYFNPNIAATVRIRVTNVAMGLRTLDTSKISFLAMNDTVGGWGTQTIPFTTTAALAADGSATISIAGGTLPDISTAGWGTYANYQVRIDRAALADHALLSSTDTTTGWFVRNEWYRLVYYAAAPRVTPFNLPSAPACTTGTDCLTVANMSPSNNKRALLILAGQSVNGTARPSSTLANYLEGGNATGAYTRGVIHYSPTLPTAQRFNDRVVVVGSN